MNNYNGQRLQYIQQKPGNDGNDSDSDEENEALFKRQQEAPASTKLIIPEEKKIELIAKREVSEQSEAEKRRIAASEEVEVGDDSEESESEPENCDLVLGQYDEVQRTKNKLGRKYKCKLLKAVFKIGQQDYVAGKLTAEIEY